MKITDKYVFFWDGIYSNWHPCKFTWQGKRFNCSEQAMMYAKAKVFGDEEAADLVMKISSPKKQKAIGRTVKGFNQEKWESVCVDIISEVLVCKFSQNNDLKIQFLKDGEGRNFVEASPVDTVWGIGMPVDNPLNENPSNWRGKNLLGICLDNAYKKVKGINDFHQSIFPCQ